MSNTQTINKDLEIWDEEYPKSNAKLDPRNVFKRASDIYRPQDYGFELSQFCSILGKRRKSLKFIPVKHIGIERIVFLGQPRKHTIKVGINQHRITMKNMKFGKRGPSLESEIEARLRIYLDDKECSFTFKNL